MEKIAKLLYEKGANMRYATGVDAPDPMIWTKDAQGKTHVPASALEISKLQAKKVADYIYAYDDILAEINSQGSSAKAKGIIGIMVWVLDKIEAECVELDKNCPAFIYEKLQATGVEVVLSAGDFFSERGVKTAEEITHLREAQKITADSFRHVEGILREADVASDGTLVYNGALLTSEKLQNEMNTFLTSRGCTGFNAGPIVAGGGQGAYPHERGHGALKAGELIVIDCFPTTASGYCGDLTRTYVKGVAKPWQKEMYAAVLAGQEAGLFALKAGINGKEVHSIVAQTLEKLGFPTGVTDDGVPYGFFHGTGHSLGLDVHDVGPSLSKNDITLAAGNVLTVEPGLYYPPNTHKTFIGGVRIEDVALVTQEGCENLTPLPKKLEIG